MSKAAACQMDDHETEEKSARDRSENNYPARHGLGRYRSAPGSTVDNVRSVILGFLVGILHGRPLSFTIQSVYVKNKPSRTRLPPPASSTLNRCPSCGTTPSTLTGVTCSKRSSKPRPHWCLPRACRRSRCRKSQSKPESAVQRSTSTTPTSNPSWSLGTSAISVPTSSTWQKSATE